MTCKSAGCRMSTSRRHTLCFLRWHLLFISLLLLVCSFAVHGSPCPGCPVLSPDTYSRSVPENSTIGTSIVQISATDPDNDTLQYSISSTASDPEYTRFTIDSTTGLISLQDSLDYETKSSYTLYVVVTDGTNEVVATATVTVLDSPEYHVVCVPPVLHIELFENTAITNTSRKLACSDPNHPSTSFSFTLTPSSGHPFSIDSYGFVLQSGHLDYEIQSQYTFMVNFTDSLGHTAMGNTALIINVLPINEFPPLFSMSGYVFSVPESTSVAVSIGQVEATDGDNGPDGELTYRITSGNGSQHFTVNPSTGDIVTLKPFDYELVSLYTLIVSVQDNPLETSTTLSNTALVDIQIADENDNAPVFTKYFYHGEVSEDSASLTSILQVQCSDRDSGMNKEVSYLIVENLEKLSIGSSTGDITVATALDYETAQEYIFTVRCVDGGSPPHTGEALVLIAILGANEYSPTFTTDTPTFSLMEDAPIGTEVGQLDAVDGDSGLAGILTFTVRHSSICPSNVIQVDPQSGKVYLTGVADYESSSFPSHQLFCTVEAADSQEVVRTGSNDLIVAISNVNDNRPQCSRLVLVATVTEDLPISSPLVSLSCTDADSSMLEYTIIPNSSMFSIQTSGSTAELVLTEPLDYETANRHELQVSVSDSYLSILVKAFIIVTGVNEHSPVFSNTMYNCTISELTSPGAVVCQVTAADADFGLDGELHYTFTNVTEDYFSLNPLTGDIYLVKPLDYELGMTSFNLTVSAQDHSPFAIRSTSVTVQITVLDVNDNAPSIASINYFSISENTTTGSRVSTVPCSDADAGTNGEVSFTILSTTELLQSGSSQLSHTPPFIIDSSSGAIFTNVSLDFETTSLYQVQVRCSDKGDPKLSSTGMVVLTIEPANEFTPSFIFPTSPLSLSINLTDSVGTIYSTLVATDKDMGFDGDIRYSIRSTNPASIPGDLLFLVVESRTGEVGLVAKSTCAYGDRLTFQATATDRGNPPLSATLTIDVTIQNCGVLPPTSSTSLYVSTISEMAGSGTPALQISCTSPSPILLPAGSTVNYRLLSDSTSTSSFTVDENTGAVAVASGGLDYETHSRHVLQIQCYYSHDMSLNTVVTAYVNVLPENEHSPVFTEAPNLVQVREDVAPGVVVASVTAMDADSGKDGEVTYSIVTSGPFDMDRTTGDVYLVGTLDRETAEEIAVVIIACDNPQNTVDRRNDTVALTVSVLDTNDNYPRCPQLLYTINLSPQVTPGSTLIQLGCTDLDHGYNATLQYSINSPPDSSELFVSVGETTGIVVLSQRINSSTLRHQTVPVTIADSGMPPLSTTVYLSIALDFTTEFVTKEQQRKTEGRENTVTVTIERVPQMMWTNEADEAFKNALARIATSWCALRPHSCSMLSGCTDFFGDGESRSRRQTMPYISFTADEVNVTLDTTQADTITVVTYVLLPLGAAKSPFHTTDHVIPRTTLQEMVTRDMAVISAMVRDVTSTADSSLSNDWMHMAITLLIIFILLLGVAFVVVIATRVHKYGSRKKNAVVPIIPTQPRRGMQVSISTSSSGQQSTPADGCSLIDVSPPSSVLGNSWSRKDTILDNLRSRPPPAPPPSQPRSIPLMRGTQDPFAIDDTELIL